MALAQQQLECGKPLQAPKRRFTMAAPKSLELTLEQEKETKNKMRYEEITDGDDPPSVGKLYLAKATAKKLGDPKTITVTITAV
jgi:hypothetical protein